MISFAQPAYNSEANFHTQFVAGCTSWGPSTDGTAHTQSISHEDGHRELIAYYLLNLQELKQKNYEAIDPKNQAFVTETNSKGEALINNLKFDKWWRFMRVEGDLNEAIITKGGNSIIDDSVDIRNLFPVQKLKLRA